MCPRSHGRAGIRTHDPVIPYSRRRGRAPWPAAIPQLGAAGLPEGRVRVPARTPVPGPPRAAPPRTRPPGRNLSRSAEERPSAGRQARTPIALPARGRAHPGTCNPVRPAAAHIPRTPDAGAAGSPSGGGLLPRSASRDVPPAPEAVSAMARTGQVRGCRPPGRRGPAGSWGQCGRERAGGGDKGRARPRRPPSSRTQRCFSSPPAPNLEPPSSRASQPARLALRFLSPPV
jgi:hypothetical protein